MCGLKHWIVLVAAVLFCLSAFQVYWACQNHHVWSDLLPLQPLVDNSLLPLRYYATQTYMETEQQMLMRAFLEKQESDTLVPKIVHFIWFSRGAELFPFHHFMSVLAAHRFIRPERIKIWHNAPLLGFWWNKTMRLVPEIEVTFKMAPTAIFGRPINLSEHQSDVARLEIMIQYGGIYLDFDAIVVRSLEPLLKHEITLGREKETRVGNGVIIAKPNALFLRIWYSRYKTFDDSLWSNHSTILAAKLSNEYPNLVHIETKSILRPNNRELEYIYGNKKYPWKENYIIHLWYRNYKVQHSLEDIKFLNNSFGEIFRYIYFGSPAVFKSTRIVPNIIHLFWYRKMGEFINHHYRHLLAIQNIVRPAKIFVWILTPPGGRWWNKA